MDIETVITPPDAPEEAGGGDDSVRLSVSVIVPSGMLFEATTQFFDGRGDDADAFASALLNVALAAASMRGSDYAWAAMKRFAAYSGGEL